MRIAERDPIAVEQAEEEPEDDLAVAVALRLAERSDRLEALALDELQTSTRRVERSVRTRGR